MATPLPPALPRRPSLRSAAATHVLLAQSAVEAAVRGASTAVRVRRQVAAAASRGLPPATVEVLLYHLHLATHTAALTGTDDPVAVDRVDQYVLSEATAARVSVVLPPSAAPPEARAAPPAGAAYRVVAAGAGFDRRVDWRPLVGGGGGSGGSGGGGGGGEGLPAGGGRLPYDDAANAAWGAGGGGIAAGPVMPHGGAWMGVPWRPPPPAPPPVAEGGWSTWWGGGRAGVSPTAAGGKAPPAARPPPGSTPRRPRRWRWWGRDGSPADAAAAAGCGGGPSPPLPLPLVGSPPPTPTPKPAPSPASSPAGGGSGSQTGSLLGAVVNWWRPEAAAAREAAAAKAAVAAAATDSSDWSGGSGGSELTSGAGSSKVSGESGPPGGDGWGSDGMGGGGASGGSPFRRVTEEKVPPGMAGTPPKVGAAAVVPGAGAYVAYVDSDDDSLGGDGPATGRLATREAAAWGSNPPSRWRLCLSPLRRPSWSAFVIYWKSLPLRRQARLTSLMSVMVAMFLFVIALSVLLVTYARSLRKPVVKVSLVTSATLEVPVISLCTSFREIPAFAAYPTDRYPGHPIFTARAFVHWEDGYQEAYPNTLTSGVVEETTTGSAAAPFSSCAERLSAMSLRRVLDNYDGFNGLKPFPGRDPSADPRCTACMRIGAGAVSELAPTRRRMSLSANRGASGLPVGFSLSLTTSDAFQFCVDGRMRRSQDTGFIFPFSLSAMTESILEHIDEITRLGILDFGGRDPFERNYEGERRWFTLTYGSIGATGTGFEDLVSMHCNVYFFSGFFYPSEEGLASVRFRLNDTDTTQGSPEERVRWISDSSGSEALKLIKTDGYTTNFGELPSLSVNAPLPDLPRTPVAPPPEESGTNTSSTNGTDGLDTGRDAAAADLPPPRGEVLQKRANITDAFRHQFASRSAHHLNLYTQSAKEAAAGPPGGDRQIAIISQKDRYVQLELQRLVDFDGSTRYLPTRLAASELSRSRITVFTSNMFNEWLFDIRYGTFVTTVNSVVAGVTPAQVAADAANYLGACTGASMFTFLIVPLNLGVAGVLRWLHTAAVRGPRGGAG